jgi:hypothetical protein
VDITSDLWWREMLEVVLEATRRAMFVEEEGSLMLLLEE